MKKTLLPVIIAVLSLAAILSSCSKTITCDDGVIEIRAVGFAQTDFDSAFAVRYKQNSAFDSVVDSTHTVYYYRDYHDSDVLRIESERAGSSPYNGFVLPGYDYRIFLPADGRIYTITKIMQQGNKIQSYSQGLFEKKMYTCTNSIISCDLDGSVVSGAPNTQSMPLNIVK